jgi:hypothetical protein
VLNVGGKFSHIGEVAALPGGPGFRDLVKSKGEGFVIRKQCEGAALQHETKMPDGLHTGKELAVEG